MPLPASTTYSASLMQMQLLFSLRGTHGVELHTDVLQRGGRLKRTWGVKSGRGWRGWQSRKGPKGTRWSSRLLPCNEGPLLESEYRGFRV